jgi:hypothetical protein
VISANRLSSQQKVGNRIEQIGSCCQDRKKRFGKKTFFSFFLSFPSVIYPLSPVLEVKKTVFFVSDALRAMQALSLSSFLT